MKSDIEYIREVCMIRYMLEHKKINIDEDYREKIISIIDEYTILLHNGEEIQKNLKNMKYSLERINYYLGSDKE